MTGEKLRIDPGPANPLEELGGTMASDGIVDRPGVVLFRIVTLTAVLLLISQIAFAWYSLKGFEQVLKPQLERKGEVVARAVGELIEFSVKDLEIPPEKLAGVDDYFRQIMGTNLEIEFMGLLDGEGNVFVSTGIAPEALAELGFDMAGFGTDADGPSQTKGDRIAAAFPVTVSGKTVVGLLVGISTEYVSNRLSDIYFDVITVIVVSWLVTIEFMVFFMNTRITSPLQSLSIAIKRGIGGVFSDRLVVQTRDEVGRVSSRLNELLHALQQRYEDFGFELREVRNAQLDRQIARKIQGIKTRVDGRYRFFGGEEIRPSSSIQIRVPLFLLMFSEELSRPFLPLFINRLAPTDSAISTEFLVGFPITLFMLVAAVFTPIGGGLVDRFGARRVFLMGAVPAAIGYFGTFLTQGYLDFIFWRGLSGVGFGLIFIAAQAWVAENSKGKNSATEMSVFVGAVFVGMICGPPFGGIIAGRLGYETTFLLSAGLAVVSGLIVFSILDDTQRPKNRLGAVQSLIGWRMLFRDPRFLAITLFAAVPGKFITAGFYFYLLPLYLNEIGNSQSVIGWLMMLYGISTFAALPLASWIADRTGRYSLLVTSGVALTGAGCVLVHPALGLPGVNTAAVIAILGLGIGHALSLTSQLAMVRKAAERYRGAIGLTSAIGAYRLIERGGLILGPLVAAPLAIAFDLGTAIAGIGIITLAFVPLYFLTMVFADAEVDLSSQGETA